MVFYGWFFLIICVWCVHVSDVRLMCVEMRVDVRLICVFDVCLRCAE